MFSIGQVASRLGLRVSAVRYYEERGLLPPVTRSANQRRYTTEHLRRLAFVQLCQDAGLALDNIAVLVDPAQPHQAWQKVVRARLDQLEEEIARLQRARETLTDALRCPADHPAIECPYVQSLLDSRLRR